MSEKFDEAKRSTLKKWRHHHRHVQFYGSAQEFLDHIRKDCGFCDAYYVKGTLDTCDECPVHRNPCQSDEWYELLLSVEGDSWHTVASRFCRMVIKAVEKMEEE